MFVPVKIVREDYCTRFLVPQFVIISESLDRLVRNILQFLRNSRRDGDIGIWKLPRRVLSSACLKIGLKFEERKSLISKRNRVGARTDLWDSLALTG